MKIVSWCGVICWAKVVFFVGMHKSVMCVRWDGFRIFLKSCWDFGWIFSG